MTETHKIVIIGTNECPICNFNPETLDTLNERIAELERQNTHLQANNTKLLLENRMLRGECEGGKQAFAVLVEDKLELKEKNLELARMYKASLAQIHNLYNENRELKASSASVAYEDGYQVANKEWRKRIYKNCGEEVIQKLLEHYKPEALINQIKDGRRLEATPDHLLDLTNMVIPPSAADIEAGD